MPTLLSVRRYPVKSCGGEDLDAAAFDARGLVGDRGWAVVDGDGKLGSGKDSRRFRRLDAIFGLGARLRDDVPEVQFPTAGWHRVDARGVDELLSEHVGADVHFSPEGAVPHQDAGAVSLVSTATLRAIGGLHGMAEPIDARHLRVNLVVDTDEPWIEEDWVGRRARIGEVELRGVERIVRCRMVDLAQDGAPAQPGLLRALGRQREAQAAVYFDVVRPGTLRPGDSVEVL